MFSQLDRMLREFEPDPRPELRCGPSKMRRHRNRQFVRSPDKIEGVLDTDYDFQADEQELVGSIRRAVDVDFNE